MVVILVPLKAAAAHTEKRNAVAVLGVEVGVYLEYEATHLLFLHIHLAGTGVPVTGCWGNANEGFQQFLHAEIVDRRTKEHGGFVAAQVFLHVEFPVNAIDQFHIFPQGVGILLAHFLVEHRAAEVGYLHHVFVGGLGAGSEQYQALAGEVVHALEILAAVDGPGHGVQVYLQFFFNFFQQVVAVLAVAVHLIDEYHHRCFAHADHFHQAAGLLFHPVHAVNHQDYAVHGGKGTVGIFRKVFVPWCVQQVDQRVLVFKGHH